MHIFAKKSSCTSFSFSVCPFFSTSFCSSFSTSFWVHVCDWLWMSNVNVELSSSELNKSSSLESSFVLFWTSFVSWNFVVFSSPLVPYNFFNCSSCSCIQKVVHRKWQTIFRLKSISVPANAFLANVLDSLFSIWAIWYL